MQAREKIPDISLTYLLAELKADPKSSEQQAFEYIDKIKTIPQWNAFVSYFKVNEDHSKWMALIDLLNNLLLNSAKLSFPELPQALYRIDVKTSVAICKTQVIEEKIGTGIKEVNDLSNLLRNLTPTQCQALCSKVKIIQEKFENIVQKPMHFNILLYQLEPEHGEIICAIFYVKLRHIIKTSYDFRDLVDRFDYEHCTIICNASAIRNCLPNIIKTSHDFYIIMRSLWYSHREIILDTCTIHLESLIQSADDFKCILFYLSSKRRATLYKSIHEKIPAMINKTEDLNDILKCLTQEQCKEIFEHKTIVHKLPLLIRTISDFTKAFEGFEKDQCQLIY